MSAGTVEYELLDSLDLGKAPPCEIWTTSLRTDDQWQCGAPAVARVRFACHCGAQKTRFVCWLDLESLRTGGRIVCPRCNSTDFHWTET